MVGGLPCMILILAMCLSLWKMMKFVTDQSPSKPTFHIGFFDAFCARREDNLRQLGWQLFGFWLHALFLGAFTLGKLAQQLRACAF